MQATTDNLMGKITTTLVVTNRIDQANAEDGLIPTDRVRTVTLRNVLVDTGATTLCLPADAIAQLGLKLLKEVDVAMAADAPCWSAILADNVGLGCGDDM